MMINVPDIEFEESVICSTCWGIGYLEKNGKVDVPCPACGETGYRTILTAYGEKLLAFMIKHKGKLNEHNNS